MKWRNVLVILALLVMALALCGVTPASAQGPLPDVQPWMAAAAGESGLGSIAAVQASFKKLQDAQADFYQYTPAQWTIFYTRDASLWMSRHKCATCWISDGYVPSPKLLIDIPIAECDFGSRSGRACAN
jgi:hypothetical protein